MRTFLQDLRYGARTLLRRPSFATVAIAVLALGVGANSAIFSLVNAVLLRPLPYHQPERLYQLNEIDPKGAAQGVSLADAAAFLKHSEAFEAIAASRWQNVTLTGAEGPENVYGGRVTAGAFSTLGRPPLIGRLYRPEDFRPGAPGVVILSHRLWERRFGGDSNVLGRELMINGQAHTIVGVMPADFFFDQRFALWTAWQPNAQESGSREARVNIVARLKRGAGEAQAAAQAEAILRNIAPEDVAKGWRVRLAPLDRQLTSAVRLPLLVLLGAVGFVLLIACLNVASLLLARGADRGREIAIRMAIGAGRLRIARQLLTESLLLAVLGGAAGLALGALAAKGLLAVLPQGMPRMDQARTDAAVWAFTAALSACTAILFGIVPAWQASRGGIRAGSPRLRNSLVVVETALSLVLLTGAGLMLRSLERLINQDLGFNPEHVLTLRLPAPASLRDTPSQIAYYQRLLERVQAVHGMNAAGLVTPLPLAGVEANATFAVEGRPQAPGERQLVKLRCASPGYFRAMGLRLRAGRVLNEGDSAGAPGVVVISEALARKYFPGEDPIGRRVGFGAKWSTIVGVINDAKQLGLTDDPAAEMYHDFRQYLFAPFAVSLTLRTRGDPMHISAAIQKEIRAFNPDQVISDVQTMDKLVWNASSRPRFYAVLLAVFGGLALLLAATGLYGVLSYAVSRRTREIGIRMALGASGSMVFRDVMRGALLLVFAGVTLGIGGSLVLTRLIAAQLYHTSPSDPVTFAAVVLVLVAVAALAAFVPARRAVRVHPAAALRYQ
ncbi:MAG: ABC transporter permease [Acidobacteria bacterium]|nr:ABC transporter permease [Acidobacteriota bacterium]